jgi:hypothetical protein
MRVHPFRRRRSMSEDTTNGAEVPAETDSDQEAKAKRIVRRVVAAPSPAKLAEARAKRLHEALLENSRRVHDELVTWGGDEDLFVPVIVETEFDGKLLAKHYRDEGWTSCSFGNEPIDRLVVESWANGRLVFSAGDTVVAPEPEPEPSDGRRRKKSGAAAK